MEMQFTYLRRTALAGALAAAALFTALTVASADHAWGVYHWQSDKLSPTVVNKVTSNLYNVPAGVEEWANLVGTPITPELTAGKKGDITVTEAFSPFWLGLARIYLDENGHITKGEVKLNTRLLLRYGADAADHVLCQELGHVLGLNHNRGELDTCMNDQAWLGSAMSPNAHDLAQLIDIYVIDHTADVVPEGGEDTGGGGGGPPCDKKPDHHHCQPQRGQWITVHVFPVP